MSNFESLIVKGKPAAPSKFIVMGDPMSGKTTLASKMPKPLFISTDGNAAKAGLDAINADSLDLLRQALAFFKESDKYESLIIDTIEGIADLFERSVIKKWNDENPNLQAQALTDIAYGRLTAQFNSRIEAFSEGLWKLPKNLGILSYTKRQLDDVSGSIVLNSELKSIRYFTRFIDGMILCSYDGEKHEARVINKRTVMAGEVEYGAIEPFLIAAGWELPSRKVKVGTVKKNK